MDYIIWLLSVPFTILRLPFLYRVLCVAIPVIIYYLSRRFRSERLPRETIWHWLFLAVLLVYLALVFYLTGFASIWSLRVDYISQIELNPLSILRNPGTSLLNIALFVPLGILLPLIWPTFRSPKEIALAGFLFSALIEISQLFTTRAVTIDDILMNTLGAVLGYALLSLVFKLHKRRPTTNQEPHSHNIGLSEGFRTLSLAALGYFLLFNWNIAAYLYQG
jgi:glycopeptide antibiotics resistance protein